MELAKIFISLFLIISQSDEVKRFSKHSNKLSNYKLVSVQCEGGLHDTGYSITFNRRVYFKQIDKGESPSYVCKNKD